MKIDLTSGSFLLEFAACRDPQSGSSVVLARHASHYSDVYVAYDCVRPDGSVEPEAEFNLFAPPIDLRHKAMQLLFEKVKTADLK